ncbi:unnamed protein product [Phyllotreta striolata]|uniref:Uncharacterized protein n=1 Tax=Phyllotreta striolata TaxID=444603 RepID=A0A9N9TAZ8_PHYSR|nr:unnamed protein product [Phyllotreta striolata]
MLIDCLWNYIVWIIRNKNYLIIPVVILLFGNSLRSKNEKSTIVPLDPEKPLPQSREKLRYFKRAAISSDAGDCANIGRDILLKNGSAVDSAIAGMICNSVVNSQSAGLGGGFFMTIYSKSERRVYCLNAREKAPLGATEEKYAKNKYNSQIGALAVGVPGEIKGYKEAHEKFGKLPWNNLIEPVIKLCDEGYIMNYHQYWSLLKRHPVNDENLQKWFYDDRGNIKKPGERIYPKTLCDFLRALQSNGPDDFYNGQLSDIFLQDVKDLGGLITQEDLVNYKVEWQEPVNVTLNNGDVFYSFPPPGSGAIIALILNILDGYNFTTENLHESHYHKHIHKLIETFKFASAQRTKLGDPNFVDMKQIIEKLLSKKIANSIRHKIDFNINTHYDARYYEAEYYLNDDHGTSHVSVIDENGNAVSATSTINIYFGAGITSKRTGLVLNSVMDDFSYQYSENYFGLPISEANRLQPGKRPLSSMAPSILLNNKGNVKTVIGAAGGPKIITAISLTLMRILWMGDSLKDAVESPRIHHQLFPMEVHYEYGLISDTVKWLKSLGHTMERRTESIVYALLKDQNNIIGIVDSRKDGGGVYGL